MLNRITNLIKMLTLLFQCFWEENCQTIQAILKKNNYTTHMNKRRLNKPLQIPYYASLYGPFIIMWVTDLYEKTSSLKISSYQNKNEVENILKKLYTQNISISPKEM